jgi:hypothetical protein
MTSRQLMMIIISTGFVDQQLVTQLMVRVRGRMDVAEIVAAMTTMNAATQMVTAYAVLRRLLTGSVQF